MHSFLLLRRSMGAAAARTVNNSVTLNVDTVVAKAVKPHVPAIKFPARGSGPVLKEVVNSAAGKPAASGTALNSSASSSKGSSVASKGSSAPLLDSSQLPQKYRRKIISNEEMEIIEKGGRV